MQASVILKLWQKKLLLSLLKAFLEKRTRLNAFKDHQDNSLFKYHHTKSAGGSLF